MAQTSNTQQAAWVAFGSLFSFGFSIASSMILSRYFSKGDYGTYKQVLYIYNTLLTVFTLGLPGAYSYFLPRSPLEQTKSLISKLTRLFFMLGSGFSLLLFFGAGIIADIMNNPDLIVAIRIFSPVPMLMLPTMGLNGILSTFKRARFIAIYHVSTKIFMLACIALPVMLFNLDCNGALVGFLVSSFLTCLLAYYFRFWPVRNNGNERTTVTLKDIFHFSLPLLYASLWGVIISSADSFFVSRWFGKEIFAEFSNGMMQIPFVGMLLSACTTVLSPVFSKMSHEKLDPKTEVFPLWYSVFRKSAMLIYPIVLFCWFFADVVMTCMYGDLYQESSSYFRIRLFENLFSIITLAPLIINIGKVKFYSNVHMWVAISVVLLEYISVITVKSPYAICIISVICQVAKWSVMLSFVAHYFGIRFIDLFPWNEIFKIFAFSIILLGADHYLLISLFGLNKWIALFVGFAVYVLLFYPYSIVVKLDYVKIVKPLLNRSKA